MIKLSDLLMGETMTITRAKETLLENGYAPTKKVREGIYQIEKDNQIEIIGEQALIDLARSLEDDLA